MFGLGQGRLIWSPRTAPLSVERISSEQLPWSAVGLYLSVVKPKPGGPGLVACLHLTRPFPPFSHLRTWCGSAFLSRRNLSPAGCCLVQIIHSKQHARADD